MLKGIHNRRGFGSPTLYAIAGLLVLLFIAGAVIMAQKATIKMYKAENERLATDNETIAKNAKEQRESDASTIEYYQGELRVCLTAEHEPCTVIVSECPIVQIIVDENKDPQLKMLNDLWRIEP